MIRLYGQTCDYSSIAVVLHGFREALEQEGLLEGVYACDLDYDQEDPPPGVLADVGVYLGVPWGVRLPRERGRHREVWAMLTPNSDTLPEKLVARYDECVTGYLAASTFARDVIAKYSDKEIVVVRHGVASESPRFTRHRSKTLLHFTTSALSRKGTMPLLEAWSQLVAANGHRDHELVVVADPGARGAIFEKLSRASFSVSQTHFVERGFGDPRGCRPEAMAQVLGNASFVVQPSRAEGFGLIPLEARAVGTPVIQTLVTGHRDHLPESADPASWGVVLVEARELAESDDWPGAQAPEVTVAAVRRALEQALEEQEALTAAAVARAVQVRASWSWRGQLADFVSHWKGESNAV